MNVLILGRLKRSRRQRNARQNLEVFQRHEGSCFFRPRNLRFIIFHLANSRVTTPFIMKSSPQAPAEALSEIMTKVRPFSLVPPVKA